MLGIMEKRRIGNLRDSKGCHRHSKVCLDHDYNDNNGE